MMIGELFFSEKELTDHHLNHYFITSLLRLTHLLDSQCAMSSNSAASEYSINKLPLFYVLFLEGCFEGGKWFLGELLLRYRGKFLGKFLNKKRTGKVKTAPKSPKTTNLLLQGSTILLKIEFQSTLNLVVPCFNKIVDRIIILVRASIQ